MQMWYAIQSAHEAASSCSSLAMAATVAIIGGCSIAMLARRFVTGGKKKTGHRRLRATSIGSTKLMVSGVLPSSSPYDSIINIALWFDTLPTVEAMQKAFTEHIIAHQRFHCTPLQTADCGHVEWVCKRVEVEKHFFVRQAAMLSTLEADGFGATAEGATRCEVEALLNTGLTTKAEGRPWWEVHFIKAPVAPSSPSAAAAVAARDLATNNDGTAANSSTTSNAGGGGVVLVRIHHALGDGISLMEMFADVILDATGTPISQLKLFTPAARGAKASFNPVKALRFMGSAVTSFFQILGLATIGGDTTCAFQNSSRQLPYQPNRFTVYFPSHSLALIKKIKDGLGAGSKRTVTVNDVEFAIFSGAIRRFLLRHGENPSNVHLRALTPFAVMETPCDASRYQSLLRNYWTFVVNDLPLADTTAVSRVMTSHSSWSRLKETALIPVAFFIHKLASRLPGAMQKQTSNDLMKRVSVVFSNVPGPQTRLFLAGQEVTSVHMLFPNIAQQVGVLSINGQLHMAMVMSTCHEKGQTRRWLSECFLEELIDASAAVGVSRMEVMKQVRVI